MDNLPTHYKPVFLRCLNPFEWKRSTTDKEKLRLEIFESDYSLRNAAKWIARLSGFSTVPHQRHLETSLDEYRMFGHNYNRGGGHINLGFGFERYNTLTDEEWKTFEGLIHISSGILKHLKTLREMTERSPMTARIIREFIDVVKSGKSRKKLKILMGRTSDKELDKNNANGLFSEHKNTLLISSKLDGDSNRFCSTLLHELRHKIQFAYDLQFKHAGDYVAFIVHQAIEAETFSINSLIEPPLWSKEIFNQIGNLTLLENYRQPNRLESVCKAVDNGKAKTITRFLSAQTEEQFIFIVTRLCLAKNRMEAYRLLKAENIVLSPKNFNACMQRIEGWKSAYFNRHYHFFGQASYVSPDKFSRQLRNEEVKWKNRTGMRLNLNSENIFSEQILNSFEIAHVFCFFDTDIFEDAKSKRKGVYNKWAVVYKYKGLTPHVLKKVEEAYQKNDRVQMERLVNDIQYVNPYVPLRESLKVSMQNCYTVFSAMKRGASVQELFTISQMDLTDKYTGEIREEIKEQVMPAINNRYLDFWFMAHRRKNGGKK